MTGLQERQERDPPSAWCVHCGEYIEAKTEPGDDVSPREDFERRYTDHVVEAHDKPRTRSQS